jgi:hypothetical protein
MIKTVLVAMALIFSYAVALAQGGGKAEPRRVEFKRGANSTIIVEKIKDDQEVEYVLAAKKGQRLTIRLTTTPTKATVFDLKAPEDTDLGLEYDANYSFNKILPITGDYLITVDRPTSAKGSASYKLVITIK